MTSRALIKALRECIPRAEVVKYAPGSGQAAIDFGKWFLRIHMVNDLIPEHEHDNWKDNADMAELILRALRRELQTDAPEAGEVPHA